MLFFKLIRDIKGNLLSTITIVIITSLGIMFWAGFDGVSSNLTAITNDFYNNSLMPDLFVTGNRLTNEDIRNISKNGAIDIMGRNVFDMTATEINKATIRMYAQELPSKLNKPVIMRGSDKDIKNPRNIMLSDDFMQANNIDVGDKISLLYGNDMHYYTVIAGVKIPEAIYFLKDVSTLYPNHKEFGYALINDSAVRDILYDGEKYVYNQIVLTTDQQEHVKSFITNKLKGKISSIIDKSEQISASMIEQELASIDSMVGVFPTIFFIISALISFTSIKRLVDKERTTIGTMKALGIKNSVVLMHYISYGLLFGVLSSLIGIPLGTVIPTAMMKLFDMFFSFPPYTIRVDYNTAFIAAFSAVAVSVISAFWASKNILSLSPSVCMRPKSAKPGKKVLIEKISVVWNKLNDIHKIVFRNMFRNKDRLIMSVVGITCSCALVFIAFGMKSSIDNMLSTVFEKVNSYDMKVYFKNDITATQAHRIVNFEQLAGGELIMETGAKVSGNTMSQKSASITILPNSPKLLGIYDGRDINEPLPSNGCIISDMLAKDLGVLEGDAIYINFTGQRKIFSLRVDKIIILNFGQGIFVSQSAWRKTGEGFMPTAALLSVNDDIDKEAFVNKINDYDFVLDAKYQSELKESMEKNLETSNTSVYIMILFAGIMAFIVLFNLGILNFYEREREIATLKVVGFYNKEVKRMAFGENYIFTTIGCVTGLVLGNLGLDAILAMSVNENYAFIKSINIQTVVNSIVMIYIFAILTNLFLNEYIRKVNMISSLKSIE